MPATPTDPFDLERFVAAQSPVFDRVRSELRAGRKQSHWIWFVFPQLKGLGSSARANFYGIQSMAEARAFLAHPILRARLEEVTRLVLDIQNRSLKEIFGSPDDAKFRSSMTLFARASADDNVFHEALQKRCNGEDPRTTALLSESSRDPRG